MKKVNKELVIDGVCTKLEVTYGLSYLQGNRSPYFSITGSTRELHGNRWVEGSGGCIHETILAAYPEFAPLVDLHLSSHDGVPMYAIENGLYYLKLDGRVYLETNGKVPEDVAQEHFRCSKSEIKVLAQFMFDNEIDQAKELVKSWRTRYLAEATKAIEQFELEIPKFNEENYKNPLL